MAIDKDVVEEETELDEPETEPMNLVITVKNTDTKKEWKETYENNEYPFYHKKYGEVYSAEQYANVIVKFFNSTLRPHESPRELVSWREEKPPEPDQFSDEVLLEAIQGLLRDIHFNKGEPDQFSDEVLSEKSDEELMEMADQEIEKAHKIIEEEEKKLNPSRAKRHLDPCNDPDCKFVMSGICAYGMRDQAGCYMEDPEKHEKLMNSQSGLIMAQSRLKYQETDYGNVKPHTHTFKEQSEETKIAIKTIDKIVGKNFHFVFKGHEYTLTDSARDQSCCPHCGHQSDDGRCWSKKDKAYIGTHEGAVCFECPNCFEKFFYHES